jgi:hypothetical protein
MGLNGPEGRVPLPFVELAIGECFYSKSSRGCECKSGNKRQPHPSADQQLKAHRHQRRLRGLEAALSSEARSSLADLGRVSPSEARYVRSIQARLGIEDRVAESPPSPSALRENAEDMSSLRAMQDLLPFALHSSQEPALAPEGPSLSLSQLLSQSQLHPPQQSQSQSQLQSQENPRPLLIPRNPASASPVRSWERGPEDPDCKSSPPTRSSSMQSAHEN